MARMNKTNSGLARTWTQLDEASGNLYNAFSNLSMMVDIPEHIKRQIEAIDITAIDSVKNDIEDFIKIRQGVLCPVCKVNDLDPDEEMNSLSRKDNKTIICNSCGTSEAMAEIGF